MGLRPPAPGELEAGQRALQQQLARRLPPLGNVLPLYRLGRPRRVDWRGRPYATRPLSFRDGLLLYAWNHERLRLQALPAGDRTLEQREQLVVLARAVVQMLATHALAPLWGLHRWRGWLAAWGRWPRGVPALRRGHFLDAHSWELDLLTNAVLHPGDDVPRRLAAGAEFEDSHRQLPPLDVLDAYLGWAAKWPALLGRDGLPLSWDHYVAGLGALHRDEARAMLRHYRAMNAAQAAAKDQEEFLAQLRPAAGL